MRTRGQVLPVLILVLLQPSFARQNQAHADKRESPSRDQDQVVKLSVTLVQVDAVVTDGRGRLITDLQEGDFEIFEDGKRQHITNFSFVRTQPASAPPAPVTQTPGAPALALPPVRLRPDQVRRTIAIVVDDLSLSMGSAESVQYYLRKYVEQQMEPGDLVAIIRASGGMGALQQFTADKRQLRSAVDRIRWNPQSGRIGVFKPITDESLQSVFKGTIPEDQRKEQLGAEFSDFREQLFTVGMLGALNYVIRGLRDLPGRKSVLLLSEGFKLPSQDFDWQRGLRRSTTNRVEDSLRRLVEFANRSAVVLYAIDPRGIVVPMIEAGDDVAGLTPQRMSDLVSQRSIQLSDTTNGLNYLARETGGFLVPGSNDLGRGIRRVLDDQNGYYLIGYVPAESTFKQSTGPMPFHKIAVRVKRPGLSVRSRGGFYGVTDEEARPPRRTPMEQLTAAVTSPFTSGDVHLKLTSLFDNDPQAGYFVRSLLHIDLRDLTFTDEADGWKNAAIDVIAITFGDNGIVVDQSLQSYTLRVRADRLSRALRAGVIYAIDLPLKKPGAYQLRTAVRDANTERTGSANQYIEVPDVNKGRLVLSAITVSGHSLPANLIQSGEADGTESDESLAEAGPAIRRLRRGGDLNYEFVVYNAKIDRASGAPQLSIQIHLLRDGRQV
jgi:VWFA-related protein